MDSGETNCILPDDLFEGILSRLPVRDLLRMRCVSKSWCALIDGSRFISMHHHAQCAMCKENGDVPLLLMKRSTAVVNDSSQWYLLSKQQGDDNVLNLNSDLERDKNSVFTMDPSYREEKVICRGSANGVICLELWCTSQDWMSVNISCCLWNPATREFRMIAYPDAPDLDLQYGCTFVVVGFMFHSVSNDLKIMTRTSIVSSDIGLAYDIYSLNTNSWKRLEPPLLLGCLGMIQNPIMGSCINGVYYWISNAFGSHMHPKLAQHHGSWVLSFNMSTELFKFSDLPEVDWDFLSGPSDTKYDIGLYKECLAVFVTRRSHPELVGNFYIWVATEFDDDFGVPLAWQCLFSSRPFPKLYGVLSTYGVMAGRMDGDLLLLINGDLCLYNPATDNISSFGIRVNFCHRYVVSLFPLLRRVVQN